MQQAWKPSDPIPNQDDEDIGQEALAENVALEALSCPQVAANKPYIAALCKVRHHVLSVYRPKVTRGHSKHLCQMYGVAFGVCTALVPRVLGVVVLPRGHVTTC